MDRNVDERFAAGFRGQKEPTPEAPAEDTPAEPPVEETPAEPPAETPAEEAAEPPAEEATETPAEEATETPAETPAEETPPEEAPAELPSEEAGQAGLDLEGGEPGPDDGGEPAGGIQALTAGAPPEIAQIIQRNADDFGEQFITDFVTLAYYFAQVAAVQVAQPLAQESQRLAQTLDAVIQGLNSMAQDDISEAHSDFQEVVNSPAFEEWVAAQPPEKQARIQRVIEGGSPQAIIRLLSDFKQSLVEATQQAGVGAVDTTALDAAAGIRGGAQASPVTGAMSAENPQDAFARGFYANRK